MIPQIITYERQARQTLTRESRQALHDRVSRAFGTLRNGDDDDVAKRRWTCSPACAWASTSACSTTSRFRTVNELFIHTQPAHLQKLMGTPLDGEERNSARARYLRKRLREMGPNLN